MPMNKLWFVVIAILIVLVGSVFFFGFDGLGQATGSAVDNEGGNQVTAYVFYGKGCPHCSRLLTFLDEIKEKYPNLEIKTYETYFDEEGRKLFEQLSESFDMPIEGVPTTFIDEKVIVGFSNSLAESLENEIIRCSSDTCLSPIDKLPEVETTKIIGDKSPAEEPGKTKLKKQLTIPAVLVAAAVDAINPCAFAVLIILLTTILVSGIKRRALMAGLAFTISIYISYFLMGIGLYSAIQATKITHKFYIVVAVLAIIIGLFNLKDFLWYGKWFIMEVPMSWRPKLQALIKGITSVPGAFLIGFAVSLFLLPCTSGPYIVILGLLSETTTRNVAVLYLLLYNAIFVLPMLVITGAVYLGLTTTEKAEKWRKGRLKILHLIAGLIMICLGIGMFIAMWLGMI